MMGDTGPDGDPGVIGTIGSPGKQVRTIIKPVTVLVRIHI